MSYHGPKSVVRMRHIPSGIVVTARGEGSAHETREAALQILRGRLFVRYEASNELVRSYSLMPGGVVLDEKTGVRTNDVQAVLDGGLDPFIEANLHRRSE